MNTVNPDSFLAWQDFNKLSEKEILEKPLEERVALFRNSMQYLVENPASITNNLKLTAKFVHCMPDVCLNDQRVDRILSTLNETGALQNQNDGLLKGIYHLFNRIVYSTPNAESSYEMMKHVLTQAIEEGDNTKALMLIKNGFPSDYETLAAAVQKTVNGYAMTDVCRALLKKKTFNLNDYIHEGKVLLCVAAGANKIELVRALIESGADVNAVNYAGNTPLLAAISQKGNHQIAKLLIEAGANVNHRDEVGNSAVMIAIQNGKKEALELLLKQPSIQLNRFNLFGRSALAEAICFSDEATVKSLIDLGADTNIVDQFNQSSALEFAIRQGIERKIPLLLDTPGELNFLARVDPEHNGDELLIWAHKNGYKEVVDRALKQGSSLMTAAANSNKKEVVELLLEEGVNIDYNIHLESGDTMLTWAIRNDVADIVVEAITSKVDIEQVDKGTNPNLTYGNSPLLVAAYKGREIFVRMLLNAGANVHKTNDKGSSALHLAVLESEKPVLLDLLLKAGANPNLANQFEKAPVHHALQLNRPNSAAVLIEGGADPNRADSHGDFPLIYALNHCKEAVELLLKAGASPNKPDSEGQMPLHVAIASKDLNSLELLLKSGASPNTLSVHGESALHYAVILNPAAIDTLLKGGANPNVVDKKGLTPLFYAAYQGDFESVDKLLNAGANPNQYPENHISVLFAATTNGNRLLLERLKKAGAKDDGVLEKNSFYSAAYKERFYNSFALKRIARKNFDNYVLTKEISRLKGIGHSFELAGNFDATSVEPQISDRLEGSLPEHWLNKMSKATTLMWNQYPEILSKKEGVMLSKALEKSSNAKQQSAEDILQSALKGESTFISTGYAGHCVEILIWGSYFIVCNRGGESRKPIEAYQFDPAKLDLEVIKSLVDSNKLTNESYRDLLFEQLPKKLDFKQGEFEKILENICPLRNQIVGNCSWSSPEAAVWAFMQLTGILGLDRNKLGNPPSDKNSLLQAAQSAHDKYEHWLLVNKLYQLERYVGLRQLRGPKDPKNVKRTMPYAYQIKSEIVNQAINQIRISPVIHPKLKQDFERMKRTIDFCAEPPPLFSLKTLWVTEEGGPFP